MQIQMYGAKNDKGDITHNELSCSIKKGKRKIIFKGYNLREMNQIYEDLGEGSQLSLEIEAVLKGDSDWGWDFKVQKRKKIGKRKNKK